MRQLQNIFLSQRGSDFETINFWEEENSPDYDEGLGWFLRRVFFIHNITTLYNNRKKIKEIETLKNEQEKVQKFSFKDTPTIKEEESLYFHSFGLNNLLRKMLEQDEGSEVGFGHLLRGLRKVYKWEIIRIVLFYWLQSICRIGFSILFYALLQTLINLEQGSISTAYLMAFFSGLLWFIGQVFMHNGFYEVTLLAAKIRSTLIGLLFAKITKMSQHMAKSQELGKIINMLSNDFNLLQIKGPWLFAGWSTPIVLIGAIILLVTRLGWIGIFCPIFAIISIPIQLFVGHFNGVILEDLNKCKDKRIKLCTQMISGIRYIKLYGWEGAFKTMIQQIRDKQKKQILRLSVVRSIERALGNSIALWSGFICFLLVIFINNGQNLNTVTIFSTLEILITLRVSLFYFGLGVGFFFDFKVILERFAGVLNLKPERMISLDNNNALKREPKIQESANIISSSENLYLENPSPYSEEAVSSGEIKFKNFDGFWNKKELDKAHLKNINLHIKRGDFCGITGKVGSGKSGLLGVILDELPYYKGYFDKDGIISYVEQEPVLFSTSVKENILFGADFHYERYKNALRDACLEPDLQLFLKGDDTIVGEKGITLSGGQKARVAIARAIYIDADIYLFDDPISAVDSKVGKQIYERVIKKLREQRKTILLVTHQISYLEDCDQVVIMENGQITHNDTPKQLKEELRKFQVSEKQSFYEEEADEKEEIFVEKFKKQPHFLEVDRISHKKKPSEESMKSEERSYHDKPQSMEKEEEQLSLKTYKTFISLNKMNRMLFPVAILTFFIAQAFNIVFFRFLAGYEDVRNGVNEIFGDNLQMFMGILAIILLQLFVFLIIKYFLIQMVIILSNDKLHKDMIQGILRSPSSYFDITNIGNLTNKFSNDLGILDTSLPYVVLDSLEGPIIALVMLGNIVSINIYFIIPGVINIGLLVILFCVCNKSIINAKQLDLEMKDPVFSTVNETISGLVQIKVFQRRKTLLKEFAKIVNNSFRSSINFLVCSRAFGVYVSYFSLVILMVGLIMGILNIQTDESSLSSSSLAGLYGITVVFLLSINDNLQWSLRQANEMESNMVSAERSFVLKDLPSEKHLRNQFDRDNKIRKLYRTKGAKSSRTSTESENGQEWPRRAILQFKNFSFKYRPELPRVLKGISFTIQEGEKVGIVGRTGAGKSSIIQAVFRIVEPVEGSIYQIDNCDALKLGLHTLRHRLSVIPQVPFLFEGDIQINLDPLSRHSEEILWKALESAGLKEKIEKLPDKLETNISNIAEVFSVGEKQLLCLARALLRNNKFLILDEVTSNVDMETDSTIQKCIHTKFQNTTVMTIAHRLNTIADYDKVIVMEKGRIREIGSPHELIEKNGLFAEMVSHTGKNADLIRKIAKESFQQKRQQ